MKAQNNSSEQKRGSTLELGQDPSAEAAVGGLQLSLSVFEGPLDLLLHLVREHKLDILDIPIAFITERYLEMIDQMEQLNLDLAGEYLLMAATLAHIKSKMLLPRPPADDEDDEDLGDPRSDLVRRLLEYQKYREAGAMLAKQDILGRQVFAREKLSVPLPRDPGDPGLREVSVFKLIEALDGVLARARPELVHEVESESVSVSARINELVERLRLEGACGFEALFADARTRSFIVATFLALLEMAKLGLAKITQDGEEGEIQVCRAEGLVSGSGSGLEETQRLVDTDFKKGA